MDMKTAQKIKNWGDKWNQKICKAITPKLLAVLLTIGYIVSLIPLLWIAKFNYPSADDYTNGSRCYHVWETGHSFFQVFLEALSRTQEEWLTWRGCFTSSFLSALPPNIWSERMYFITTWIVLLTLSLATVFFFYELLVKGLGADCYTSYSISMITLFISVQCMGISGRTESFYWYSGAINYTFIHGLSLFFYGLLIFVACNEGKKKVLGLVLASVLGFLVAGGNQMTMLNTAIVLFVVAVFLTVLKKWRKYKGVWIPIVSFYVGFIIGVVAPGNLVRANTSSGMNPIKAVFVSFYYCLDLMINQWTTWPILLLLICIVPLYWYMVGNMKFMFPYPLLVTMFGYCLVSAMATPPLFAMGNIEAGRLQGLMFFMYVLVLVLCVGYVTGWARNKYECMSQEKKKKETEPKCYYEIHSCQCLIGCMLFFLIGSMIFVIPEPHFYSFTSAVTDISNGSAVTYREELEKRAEAYCSNAGKALVVEPLSVQPQLLFFTDLDKNPEDWKNRGICRYYGLESVALGDKE